MYTFKTPDKNVASRNKAPAPSKKKTYPAYVPSLYTAPSPGEHYDPNSEHNIQQTEKCIFLATPYSGIVSPVIQCYIDENPVNDAIEAYKKSDMNNASLDNLNKALKHLQVIHGVIEHISDGQYSLNENKKAVFFPNFDNLSGFLLKRIADRNLNEENRLKDTVLFGNEFTFRNMDETFQFDAVILKNNYPSPLEKVKNKIEDWVNKTKELSSRLNYKIIVSQGKKKWPNTNYDAYLITFKDNFGKEVYHYNIDLDPYCIEIQTMPISLNKYENFRNLIQTSIFDVAGSLGLIADTNPKTGGGGHISFDVQAAFGKSGHYLRNFLVSYALESQKTGGKADKWIPKSTDVGNAPFMHELHLFGEFQRTIQNFDNIKNLRKQSIAKLVKMIHEDVYSKGEINEDVAAQIRKINNLGETAKIPDEDKYHYQAVNLTHINETNPSLRRVEMRRFDAQATAEDTLEQINVLMNLLLKSRQSQNLSYIAETET